MTNYIPIENWWIDLSKQYRNYMGSGFDLIEHLDNSIQQSDRTEKIEVINFLTQKAINEDDGYAIALSVLEKHCTDDCLELIFKKTKLIDFDDEKIIPYLNVIGKKGTDKNKQLLADFLLSDNLNKNHSLVQWAVYPTFPDLFAKAYSRYLVETNYKEWTGSAIVQAFMTQPQALEVVRDFLKVNNHKVWQYLKNDLHKELTKDLWDMTKKKKIERIICS